MYRNSRLINVLTVQMSTLNLDSDQIDFKWESDIQISNLGSNLDQEFIPPFLGRFVNLPSRDPAYIIGDACGGFEVGCFDNDEQQIAFEEGKFTTSTVECHSSECKYYVGCSIVPEDGTGDRAEMRGYVGFYTAVDTFQEVVNSF